MKLLNSPWRVERESGGFVVVDSKNTIVCNLDCSDPEELPGTKADEEAKAYAIAALPELLEKADAFWFALCDPVTQLDEDLLMKCAEEMNTALQKAKPPEAS